MRLAARITPIFIMAVTSLAAGDLPASIQAKFIRILATSASASSIECNDTTLVSELGKIGIGKDDGSKVAWAATAAEAKSFKAAGKLVICGKLEWLSAGGSIAILEENNKPQIYLHTGNIAASGVTLSDAVLKIGKKL